MRAPKQIGDEIRLKILEALLEKGSVAPNIRQIQRKTGFHKATIKASLDFLAKEGLLQGYGPKINFHSLGYKLETTVLLQADMSEKKTFDELVERIKKDPHIYQLASVIGSGNWNLLARHIYKDVESYHNNDLKNYYEAIPGIFKVIKDRQIFYATEPYYKSASRTRSIIELIRRSKEGKD